MTGSDAAADSAAPAAPTQDRERYLDVYRAIALIRVGFYHVFGYAWLSILFPAMGVMFAVAGSLTARSLDRAPGGVVVAKRMRRLLPSVWLLGIVAVPVMLWHGWSTTAEQSPLRWNELVYWIVPVFDPPGSEWAANATAPLWYVRAYLWFVLLSPLLLRAFRRWPVPTMVAPLALIVAGALGWPDLDAYGATGDALRDFGTYGACWILGFAHRAGMLRRIPLRAAVALAAMTMTAGLWWALTHRDGEFGYDLNEIPMAQALWSVGIVLLLMRWAPNLDGIDRVPVLGRLVTLITARAVTIYLWHNIAIDLAVAMNDRLGLYSMPALVVSAVALTTVAILLFGWVEDLAARRSVRLLPGFGTNAHTLRRLVPWPSIRATTAGGTVLATNGSGSGHRGSAPPPARNPRPQTVRFGALAIAALLLAAWVGPPVARQLDTSTTTWSASAYYVPWDEDRGLDAMDAGAGVLDSVSPVWYTPQDDGGLVRNAGDETATVISRARAEGISVVPSISNFRDGAWDAELVSSIVRDPVLRRTHVEAIVREVVNHGYDGIDIDYESLDVGDHRAFGGFVRELGTALHERDRTLTVALLAGTFDDTPELAPLYEAVGEAADEVRVMAYDYSWQGSDPGPIAPVDWVHDVLAFAVRYVPPERVVLGLAAHGYDWGGGDAAEDVVYTDAEQIADDAGQPVRWNADAESPWFAYTDDDGAEHEVWFEDASSLDAKLEVVESYDVGGVFLWRLGGEDPEIWPVLRRHG